MDNAGAIAARASRWVIGNAEAQLSASLVQNWFVQFIVVAIFGMAHDQSDLARLLRGLAEHAARAARLPTTYRLANRAHPTDHRTKGELTSVDERAARILHLYYVYDDADGERHFIRLKHQKKNRRNAFLFQVRDRRFNRDEVDVVLGREVA